MENTENNKELGLEGKDFDKSIAQAQAKAEREAKKAAKEAAKKTEKELKKSEREAKAKAKADAKLAEKELKKLEKQAKQQPTQNGVRRPNPDGLCGQVWALADELSQKLGQAVPIKNLLDAASELGLNSSNVRTEYARWKKFHSLSGRIVLAEKA